MSNKLPKEEIIVKCTKTIQKKTDGTIAVSLENKLNGTTYECMIALAALMKDLESEQPEEDRASFRANMMKTINDMRLKEVVYYEI